VTFGGAEIKLWSNWRLSRPGIIYGSTAVG
jgi:hypothetical protein